MLLFTGRNQLPLTKNIQNNNQYGSNEGITNKTDRLITELLPINRRRC